MTFSIAESHRFLLSYCLFRPLQIIRIRMRKSLVEILDHCVQIGQMNTTIPTLDGGEGYASNGGCGLYITANCGNVDLAKSFLAYTFGGSTQTYDNALRDGGVVTTVLKCADFDVYNEGVEFFNNEPIYKQIVEIPAYIFLILPVCDHADRDLYMQASGVDIQTIQSIVGHADTEMTEHYLHVQESIRQSAIQLFSEAFSA